MPEQLFAGEKIVGPSTADDDVLRVEHISKRFGPVTALRDINMHLRKGEVLGLLGDNGAGKSTLMKILCGFEKPDSGTMTLRGEPYEPRSVDHARSLGIDVLWALGVVIVLQLVLTFTRWGIYTVAVGGNRHGAAEAGIKVRLVIIRNFVLCASLAALGGVLGALLLGILNDGLIIKGVNADYLSFYLGLAIIIAMAANTYVGRIRTGGARA